MAKTPVSRRSVLAGATGVLAAPMVLKVCPGRAQSNSLTITSYGGVAQDVLIKTVTNPFTEETGIKVNIVPTPDIAKVKAQALTSNVEFDVFDTSDEVAAYGSKQGFWDKLDLSMLDLDDLMVPPTSELITMTVFVGGIAWDPKRYAEGKHPSDFAEYFDLKKFPGRRTFRNRPNETLEAALLADGVQPKDMYPLDVDRAFKVLDGIKPSVASWITATAQTTSLLQTGEVDFSYTYSSRVQPTNQPGGGAPLAFSFKQNLLGAERFAIPKGAPNKVNAMKYIAFFFRPEVQLRYCNELAVTPNSKKAFSMVSADSRKWMADLSNPNNAFVSGAYWSDNLERVARRFKEWVLS